MSASANSLTDEDLLGHTFVVGATGAGKTNLLLYTMQYLAKRGDAAVIFIDPHGDATMDLAGSLPLGTRMRIFDPFTAPFALNPLEIGHYSSDEERKMEIQTRVGEMLNILRELFGVEAARAPRLLWIVRSSLFFLYDLADTPTFLDLYDLLSDLMRGSSAIQSLMASGVGDEVLRRSIEGISEQEPTAFTAAMNRISNFVLPPQSITSRTFCTRRSTVPWDELLQPGSVSSFRLSASLLPEDFRRVLMSTVVMDVYFAVERRRRASEPGSGSNGGSGSASPPTPTPTPTPTPVYLVIDEFQSVAGLEILQTILAEARKLGLFLVVANQNLQQIPDPLLKSILGNTRTLFSFRVGPEDAAALARTLGNADMAKALVALPNYTAVVRRVLTGGTSIHILRVPRADPPTHEVPPDWIFSAPVEEDRTPIYLQAMREGGVIEEGWTPALWATLCTIYLRPGIEHTSLAALQYHRYGWDGSITQSAVNELRNRGLISAAKSGPGRGSSATISYRPTAEATRYFAVDVVSPRAGGAVHQEVMRRLLHEYWESGYWTSADMGEKGPGRPDIIYVEPVQDVVAGKDSTKSVRHPTRWDLSTTTAVEVETLLGGVDGAIHNYARDKRDKRIRRIAFAVAGEKELEALNEALKAAGAIPGRDYTIVVVHVGEEVVEPPDEDVGEGGK